MALLKLPVIKNLLPETDSEQIIVGVKANEFGGRLVLILGIINKEAVVCGVDSILLGRGLGALPQNLDSIDIGVDLDYVNRVP